MNLAPRERRRKSLFPYLSPSGNRYTLYADMLKQPHLLIAGATGSGKSVVINALIYTALFNHPTDGSGGSLFILIDPKRVELAQYKALPHTLQYASEPDEMRQAIYNAMQLCENRYREMQRGGARLYNGGDVYIIIDEFADLMTTQKRLIMPPIQRLAQIGRAAKVHIVLATQTPIAKILPTEIKCNFDARIALRTRSAQDSRNILGLLGQVKQCFELPPDTKLPFVDTLYSIVDQVQAIEDLLTITAKFTFNPIDHEPFRIVSVFLRFIIDRELSAGFQINRQRIGVSVASIF